MPAEAAKAGKGKQKKTYVNDGDQDMLRRIVEQVASGVDRGIESKLEKAVRCRADFPGGARGLELTCATETAGDDSGGETEGG